MKLSTIHNDTPLGSWIYSEWRPPHLAGMVDVIWYFKGPTSSARKRILPNGMVEMLVNFGEPYRIISGAGPEWLKKAWLAGLQSGPMIGEQPPRQDVMGLRMCPAGAYALLNGPMREISELVVDLDDLVGRAADELAERCYGAASVEERFQWAADWVAKRVMNSRGIDPAVAWAAEQIEQNGVIIGSDLNMLVMTGGRERTEAEFRALLEASGLRIARIVTAPLTAFSVIETLAV
ncbi:MAG: hypothetical protein J2P52_18135 [Blastocatellia bacterium]|nr:hypothetical protein [Blastocatellia bacterium]